MGTITLRMGWQLEQSMQEAAQGDKDYQTWADGLLAQRLQAEEFQDLDYAEGTQVFGRRRMPEAESLTSDTHLLSIGVPLLLLVIAAGIFLSRRFKSLRRDP